MMYTVCVRQFAYILTLVILLLSGCRDPFIGVELCIETSPPGAEIVCGGKFLGKTPKTVQVSGFSSVQIELSGYKSEVIVSNDQKSPRTYKYIQLQKFHQIEFDYKPSGAEVWDGDEMIGKTPFVTTMTKGEKVIRVTLLDHEDYIDRFYIHGETYRTEELAPTMKYLSQNICYVNTNPTGANAESLVICDDTLANEIDEWGTTPIEGTNADIMESTCDRFFILRHPDKYPAILRFRGSINANIELEDKTITSIPNIPKNGVIDLNYQTKMNDESSFSVSREGDLFKVYSKKYSKPVSIVDLETPASNVSGASWLDERFFVIRTKNEYGNIIYVLFDNFIRRRVRFEDCGFYRERNVPGIMRLGEQIPISIVRLDTFHDFRYVYFHSGILFFIKPYTGRDCWFVIFSDMDINISQIINITIE